MEAPSVESAIRLDDAIHSLAQPLTALMFVLEMARLQSTPEAWRKALETAGDECRRAIDILDEVRAAAAVCAPVPEKYDEGELQ